MTASEWMTLIASVLALVGSLLSLFIGRYWGAGHVNGIMGHRTDISQNQAFVQHGGL